MDQRQTEIKLWLDSLGYQGYSLDKASEDASFRRYFRLQQGDQSWIVMDAPPEKESCEAFVTIARQLTEAGLSAPEIIHENHQQGFLILTDLGNQCYLDALNAETVNGLYDDALKAIVEMQTQISTDGLPVYDEDLLRQEMDLFKHWFLEQLLGIELNTKQRGIWQMTTDYLVKNALEQPQVFVHRDFHSRNLMILPVNNPGILDFQDACRGAVTYDLVSLLRDCYVDWPESQVDQWVLDYHHGLSSRQLLDVDAATFMHWFNLMGAQRHLKAVGIFSRLHLRDGKDQFLNDIPRTLNYLNIIGTTEKTMMGLYAMINELSLGFRVKSMLRAHDD